MRSRVRSRSASATAEKIVNTSLDMPFPVTSLPKSLLECAISRIYTDSAVSALSLEQALACKIGCPLLARSLWAGFRQPRRQSFFGQAIEIAHSNRLSANGASRRTGRHEVDVRSG